MVNNMFTINLSVEKDDTAIIKVEREYYQLLDMAIYETLGLKDASKIEKPYKAYNYYKGNYKDVKKVYDCLAENWQFYKKCLEM